MIIAHVEPYEGGYVILTEEQWLGFKAMDEKIMDVSMPPASHQTLTPAD